MANEVNVKVSADASPFKAGLAEVRTALHEFKREQVSSLQEVGKGLLAGFAVAGIIEGLKGVAEELDRVEKLSQRFGESAESIQRIGYAAKLSGTDMETVSKAMTKLNGNAIGAINGSTELAKDFSDLGINAKEFYDLPMEDKLLKLAEAYNDSGSNGIKLNAAMKVMGKSAGELIPLFANGSEALKEMFDDAKVVSNESVAKIAENMDRLESAFMNLKAVGGWALGFLIEMADGFVEEMAIATAYITNLPQGFKAAAEAAKAVKIALANEASDKAKEKEDKAARAKSSDVVTADNTKDIAKLEDDIAKKREELHKKIISSKERELEIEKKLKELEKDRQSKFGESNEDKLKRESEKLDLLKEQADLKVKMDKDAKDAAKEQLDFIKAKDKVQAKMDAESFKVAKDDVKKSLGDVLDKDQDKLSKLKGQKLTVDSLRSIGGGLAGVDYAGGAKRDTEFQKQIKLLEDQVALDKQAITILEKLVPEKASDGSFE